MRKLTLHIVLFFTAFAAQAQYGLQDYTISSRVDDHCVSFVTLPLFPKESKRDFYNGLIAVGLLDHHYMLEQSNMDLDAFYNQREYPMDSALPFTIMGGCTFAKNGIFSFTACPFNACDEKPLSEMEAMMVVIDTTKQKKLVLKDIIDLTKYDTFVSFSHFVANRYRIKNIPACSYSSRNPVVVSSSTNGTVQGNEITFEGRLDTKFYIKPNMLVVHLLAQHSRYPYSTVELPIPINLVEYFLKEEYRKRIMK